MIVISHQTIIDRGKLPEVTLKDESLLPFEISNTLESYIYELLKIKKVIQNLSIKGNTNMHVQKNSIIISIINLKKD